MLEITDIGGNTELLMGVDALTRNRKVNGEKTLEFKAFSLDNDADVYEMVMPQSIVEFDGDPYVIKKVSESNAGSRSIKTISAVHKFFVDLIDSQVHAKLSGLKTFYDAIDHVFSGSGYTTSIIDAFDPQTLDNLGADNRLALFQQVLNLYGAEFSVAGTVVTLRKEIGNRTDFQFRYAHNVNTIDQQIDTTNLSTVINGYGKQNEDGTFVATAEYRSPNESIFGAIDAPEFHDDSYTDNTKLLDRLKMELRDEPEVSMTIDFADLRASGYVYMQPNEGDYGFIIYEPMNIDVEARIVEVKETFDANLLPIQTSVTLSNLRDSVTQIMADFSATSKTLGKILSGQAQLPFNALDDAVKLATQALKSAQTELKFENGILAIDKTNPNNLVIFNSAGIGISDDAGATFSTAMTGAGIVADVVTAGTLKGIIIEGNHIIADQGVEFIGSPDSVSYDKYGNVQGGPTSTPESYWNVQDPERHTAMRIHNGYGGDLNVEVSRDLNVNGSLHTVGNGSVDGFFNVGGSSTIYGSLSVMNSLSAGYTSVGSLYSDFLQVTGNINADQGVIKGQFLHSNFHDGDTSHLYLRPPYGYEVKVMSLGSTTNYQDLRAYDLYAENTVYAKGVNLGSSATIKTNIKPYTDDSIDLLKSVNIYNYHLQDSIDKSNFNNAQIGMLAESLPAALRGEQSNTVNLYAIPSVLWKVCQTQQESIEALQKNVSDLEMTIGAM